MTKKKKYKTSVLNRINKDKSNRMVIAVVIGFALILLIWLIYMFGSGEKGPPQVVAEKVLRYLEKTEGIGIVQIKMEQKQVDIRYDYFKPRDFVLITRYAALKLSNSLPKEPINFTLTPEITDAKPVYRCKVLNGALESEWLGELPTPPALDKSEENQE